MPRGPLDPLRAGSKRSSDTYPPRAVRREAAARPVSPASRLARRAGILPKLLPKRQPKTYACPNGKAYERAAVGNGTCNPLCNPDLTVHSITRTSCSPPPADDPRCSRPRPTPNLKNPGGGRPAASCGASPCAAPCCRRRRRPSSSARWRAGGSARPRRCSSRRARRRSTRSPSSSSSTCPRRRYALGDGGRGGSMEGGVGAPRGVRLPPASNSNCEHKT